MEDESARLSAVLESLLVAVSALMQTHPDLPKLRIAFESIATKAPGDPETMEVLRKSIR